MRWMLVAAVSVTVLSTACANPDPPVVEASPLGDTRDAIGPYLVSASIVENREVAAVRLYHRSTTADQAAQLAMSEVAPGRFEASMPGYPPGTRVRWFIEAEDADGNFGYDPPESELGDSVCLEDLAPEDPVPSGGAAFCFSVLR